MTSFDLSFDYRCPFAKNIHLHVISALRAEANFDVNFVPWSLNQGHRDEGAPDVWDDPARDADNLALVAGVSVRDLQSEHFLDAHEALFLARHERGVRLTTMEEIKDVLAPLGVDTRVLDEDIASRRPHDVLGAAHKEFAAYEAFGVPTFVLDGDATFVRYMTPPSDPRHSIDLITRLIAMMRESELNEFKHTRLPR